MLLLVLVCSWAVLLLFSALLVASLMEFALLMESFAAVEADSLVASAVL